MSASVSGSGKTSLGKGAGLRGWARRATVQSEVGVAVSTLPWAPFSQNLLASWQALARLL